MLRVNVMRHRFLTLSYHFSTGPMSFTHPIAQPDTFILVYSPWARLSGTDQNQSC